MTAEKIKTLTFASKEAFDKKCEEIVGFQNRIDVLAAEQNREIELLKLSFKEKLEPLRIAKRSVITSIFGWLMANRELVFGKRKSARCATGTYGLRKSKKSLQLSDADADEDEIAKKLFDAGKTGYVSTVYKLDKNAIKRAMADGEDEELLERYFQKTQEVEFYVKPDDSKGGDEE